jgi:opacity protein-like surface antigen
MDKTKVEESGSENNFALQVELGVDYTLRDCLILNTGLRYVDLEKTKIDLDNENVYFRPSSVFPEFFHQSHI